MYWVRYSPIDFYDQYGNKSKDKNVGINRELVIEPTISNARGYRDQVEDPDELLDINLFAPNEMLTPATIRSDDPIRSAMESAVA